MRSVDTEHGGTEAAAVVERNDATVGVLVLEPVDEMDFGADCKPGAGGRVSHAFDDVLGRNYVIGKLGYFPPPLWIRNHRDTGMSRPRLGDVLGQKALMNRTMAL